MVLSSNKTHGLTRFCAAFFGVAIIGCGAPVFCVIVKTSLYAARACSGRMAFFIGAVFPYLVRYLMYPGPDPYLVSARVSVATSDLLLSSAL